MALLLTDSAADIPISWMRYEGVEVLPLKIMVKGKIYISKLQTRQEDVCSFILRYSGPESFEKYLKLNHKVIEPTEEEIREKFSKNGEVVGIFASSLFFSMVLRARKVASEFEKDIYCIDSSSVSAGEGILVWKAIQLRNEGFDADEIVKHIEKIRKRVRAYFAIYHREIISFYQKKIHVTGDISGFPVISLEPDEIRVIENPESFQKALEVLEGLVEDTGPENTIITHFCNPKAAEELMFNIAYPADITEMDLSVGSFFGPRAVGVGFLD